MKGQDSNFQEFSFIADPSDERILYSTFGAVYPNHLHFHDFIAAHFLPSDKSEAQFLRDNWKTSLHAVNSALRQFECLYNNPTGPPVPVLVKASRMRLHTSSQPDTHILFTITESDPDQLSHIDEKGIFYKNEYEAFIHTAAHDLDSPARKISVLVERLIAKFGEKIDSDTLKEYSGRIESSIGELKSLIDSIALLSLCILEKVSPGSCDIAQIVSDALKELKPRLEAKNGRISINPLPVIEADILQMRLLFRCLLDNAVKFSRDNIAPDIGVSCEVVPEPDKGALGLKAGKLYYRITISDNGIGMHAQYGDRIFRPFERLNGKSQFPGSGLGLTIAKRILDNHKGVVYADVHRSAGSAFVLILPQIQY